MVSCGWQMFHKHIAIFYCWNEASNRCACFQDYEGIQELGLTFYRKSVQKLGINTVFVALMKLDQDLSHKENPSLYPETRH